MSTRDNQKKNDDKNNDNMANSIYSKAPIDQGGNMRYRIRMEEGSSG